MPIQPGKNVIHSRKLPGVPASKHEIYHTGIRTNFRLGISTVDHEVGTDDFVREVCHLKDQKVDLTSPRIRSSNPDTTNQSLSSLSILGSLSGWSSPRASQRAPSDKNRGATAGKGACRQQFLDIFTTVRLTNALYTSVQRDSCAKVSAP